MGTPIAKKKERRKRWIKEEYANKLGEKEKAEARKEGILEYLDHDNSLPENEGSIQTRLEIVSRDNCVCVVFFGSPLSLEMKYIFREN